MVNDAEQAAPSDALQSWMNKNAVSVRSIDMLDEDFKDLEFLVDVIGDARLVQLGEASHQGGSGFSAKARLVKFLHQRMGFDVLVWEEGIYDLRLAQAGMRSSGDVRPILQQAIRPGWSTSEEIRPLFEYAKASQASLRPLDMAGYDARFSPQAFDSFTADLRAFVAAVPDAAVRKQSQALVESAVAAHNRSGAKDVPPGNQEDLDNLHRTADALLKAIDTNRGLFERVHGPRDTSFMERAIETMRSDGTGKFYMAQMVPGSPDAPIFFSKTWSERDDQGARNLRWLADEEYSGRKLIYWAHSAHVIDAYMAPMFKGVLPDGEVGAMKPVGIYIDQWLGDKAYTICLAHYDGAERAPDGTARPVPIAPPASIEARLHEIGQPYLFLNLRPAAKDPRNPLHEPQNIRIGIPTVFTVPDITKILDGIFYVGHLTPSTLKP